MARGPASRDNQAEFKAFEQVHTALLPLTAEQRGRLIAAVTTLLATSEGIPSALGTPTDPRSWTTPTRAGRPLSLVELLKEKSPTTSAGKITLFAYHREKNEGKPRFSRGDLKNYFAAAHEQPPANYDRDFIAAVKKGWIHEDGGESYVTSKGIDEVEAGFANELKRGTKPRKKATKKKPRGRAAR